MSVFYFSFYIHDIDVLMKSAGVQFEILVLFEPLTRLSKKSVSVSITKHQK